MKKTKYVSWRRVSTFRQSKSGLGLEAQKEIVRYFVGREGGEIIADYAECYTGKELSGCTELRKAIAHAKSENAVLVIAKSDRFRNTIEALQIYEEMGDGNIMFCDLPHTDKFTLTLFFALAEREALIVSIRTKQALSALKSRGCVKLGAANEKYKENRAKKDKQTLIEIQMRKGETKRMRYRESRDVVAFRRVLTNIFPDATRDEDPANWEWGCITTKNGNKDKMLRMMSDYQSLDESGALFRKWNFHATPTDKLLVNLCSFIQRVRRSYIQK